MVISVCECQKPCSRSSEKKAKTFLLCPHKREIKSLPNQSSYASCKRMIGVFVPPDISVTARGWVPGGKDVTEFVIPVTFPSVQHIPVFPPKVDAQMWQKTPRERS